MLMTPVLRVLLGGRTQPCTGTVILISGVTVLELCADMRAQSTGQITYWRRTHSDLQLDRAMAATCDCAPNKRLLAQAHDHWSTANQEEDTDP